MTKKRKYIIGIDEVGRGALAGPVAVAAVAAPRELTIKNKELRIPLRDSKKLSSKQREAWFTHIQNHPQIFYATAFVSRKMIDKINVSNAANLAASRSLQKLLQHGAMASYCSKLKAGVFLDGGLYVKKPKTKNWKLKTVIKGDEKIPAIALASIIAKISRDRLMKKLHKKYPQYGFNKHKGYGTKAHIKAIKKFGPSPIQRKSFKIK